MIISNQIEHLKNLYKELKYAEVIQFGTITLPFSLEEKRYDDALVCYEYIASAYFETGNLESFLVMMNDYEKLCLTYGKDQNKMIFYYLLSLLNVMFGKHDESIEASKKSIKYAHYLKRNELIVINYYNISAQFAHTDQIEKAGMAMCLANYYKREMPYLNPTIVRGYLGALYYFAVTRNNDEFQKNKQDFSERLKGKYSFYHGNMLIAEAILKFNLGYVQESVSFFERAFLLFKAQHNTIFLTLLEKYVNKFNIGAQFQYTDELQQTIQNAGSEPLNPNNIQSVHTDLFFAEEVHAATFKYPNVISKEQIVQHVEMALLNDEALYCIHWGFVTNEIEELFGNLFVEQLLFTLFEAIYQLIFKHNAEVNVLSKNEGEAFIKNITEAEFFKLLMELEEKLQSTVVHSTSGSVKIPIHFGFIHTDQLPKDQVSYEQLAAFADAGLYYAKSHGQLYIYS